MKREAMAPVDAEEIAKCAEELERVASAVTRSLFVCHEAHRLQERRLARVGVSKVDSANGNRSSSSSGRFLVHHASNADCYRMPDSQFDVVGAGGASGALIDAEEDAAKLVLLLVSVFFCCCQSQSHVCLCVRCILAFGCSIIRYTRRTCRTMYVEAYATWSTVRYTRAMPVGI